MTRLITPAKMVHVVWLDAAHHSGWFDVDDAIPKTFRPMEITTVGFLYAESDESIYVAQSITSNGGFGEVAQILKAEVQSIRHLCVRQTKVKI